jgi:hypothetical protein
MANHSFLRRIFTAILLSTLLLSCQTRVTRETEQTKKAAQSSKPNNSTQKIIYGDLVIKEQSDYIMIPVSLAEDKNQNRKKLLDSSSYYERSNLYSNIIFYRKKDGVSHLLLTQKALISSFELLERKQPGKPLTRFLLYRIIETDTNGDKKLTPEDATLGYLSDMAGKNLQQITPNNTQFISWTVVQSIGAIFIKIIKDSDKDKKITERDETTFIKVDLDKPSIGTEIISDKIKQKIRSLSLK